MWGLIIELGGVASVFYGVRHDRREFTSARGVQERLSEWTGAVARRLRSTKSEHHEREVTDSLGITVTVSATGRRVRRWPDELEDQLAWLKREIQEVRGDGSEELNRASTMLEDLISNLGSRVDEAVRNTDIRFQDFVTGGLRFQFWGGVAVVVGLIFQAVAIVS